MSTTTVDEATSRPLETAALIALPVRLVIGWTYFSAFWRRMVLADKLDPTLPGYIGEKFNHFLPNALGIGPIIEHLVTHPDLLRVAMIGFTLVEAVVGACVILGLFTRIMGLGVLGLAFGILISAGWLGTTCLDEWQIGILGVAGGAMLFLSGGGRYSLDHLLAGRKIGFTQKTWFRWVGSGEVTLRARAVLGGAVVIFALALFTNQYFHGGVYGPLHNKSVAPELEISQAHLSDTAVEFQLYRTEGVDVYGSYLIGVAVVDDTSGAPLVDLDGDQLARLPASAITNRHVAQVKPGAHALVVPLGAKATLRIATGAARVDPAHRYTLRLTDISGATWQSAVDVTE